MMNLFLALIVFFAVGAVLWKAHGLGDGNIWLGLKRYFDLNYQTDQEENKDIEHGLVLLSRRLDTYTNHGWTIEFQQGRPDGPPPVRLVLGTGRNGGVYLYDSPAELLQKWSLPPQKEVK